MNTPPKSPNIAGEIESSDQLLAQIRTQSITLIMDVDNSDAHKALIDTIASWSEQYGTMKNLVEVAQEFQRAISACFHVEGTTNEPIDPRMLQITTLLYGMLSAGLMTIIDKLKKQNDTSDTSALSETLARTTESLGSVFAEGYFPTSTPKSDTLLTSEGRPVDRMTRMILTEGFPAGDMGPTTKETEYSRMLRQALPDTV